MTDYQSSRDFTPSMVPTLRSRCPLCQKRMMLIAVAPGPEGFEHHSLQCTACRHVEKIVIVNDPMKSNAVGWLTSDLKPPN